MKKKQKKKNIFSFSENPNEKELPFKASSTPTFLRFFNKK
jgi:hypothetical protein